MDNIGIVLFFADSPTLSSNNATVLFCLDGAVNTDCVVLSIITVISAMGIIFLFYSIIRCMYEYKKEDEEHKRYAEERKRKREEEEKAIEDEKKETEKRIRLDFEERQKSYLKAKAYFREIELKEIERSNKIHPEITVKNTDDNV